MAYNSDHYRRCIDKSIKCVDSFMRIILKQQMPRKQSRRARMWWRTAIKWDQKAIKHWIKYGV